MGHKWVLLNKNHVKNSPIGRLKETQVSSQLQFSCKHNQMQKTIVEITNDC